MNIITNRWYWIVGFVLALQLAFTMTAFADTLCGECNVYWIKSEDNSEYSHVVISLIKPDETHVTVTTSNDATGRQKDQIISMAMAALLSGKKVDAIGTSGSTDSFYKLALQAE